MSEYKHEWYHDRTKPRPDIYLLCQAPNCGISVVDYIAQLEASAEQEHGHCNALLARIKQMEESRDSYYEDTKTLQSHLDRALGLAKQVPPSTMYPSWLAEYDALLKECGRKP